jgi:tetratricopeptide (TPR) repeat protein
VVQYLGDGLLVYFGHPQAHEDDAERAVRAGREILRQLQLLNPRLEDEHGVRIAARIGIHTGPVVVDEIGGGEKKEVLALGDTTNVAARLQGFAEPDTVVVSDATLKLVAGLFVTEDRGMPALKGIRDPIRVYRVLQPSGVTSRLDRARALTPFVGREQELGLLLERFEQVQEGRGQAVLIAGEAGIGKSRLAQRVREKLSGTPHSWLECQTTPYTQGSALHPVVGLLEQALGFQPEDSAEEKLARLERGLIHVGFELAESVPLLASLLSLRLPEGYTPLEISPQRQRQKTLAALLEWLLALGEKQPLVLLVEDLHWVDPSTQEWLGLVIEQCPTASVLLLLTFRPQFQPPWPSREHVLQMGLTRLRRREAKRLVVEAAADETLADGLIDRLAERSDGIPLFVEELAKAALVESSLSSELVIPETLQDSLMARLDRLGEAKQVAQLGAAFGREFSYALLEAVAPMRESELQGGLARLVEAELVYQRGVPPKASYTFKHALVQDTAYQSMLESQRQELHGRIADALEALFPERVARDPGIIARHCKHAGRVEDAIAHYERAAERATQIFAQAEAIAHLHEALALLSTLAEGPERNQQDLQLQIALGSALFAAKGGWDPECEQVYGRARALCGQAPESPALIRALLGLSLFHYARGDLRISCELGEHALALAERGGEVYARLAAHTRLGVSLLYLGKLKQSQEHLERASALYDPSDHRRLAAAWGQDWGTTARSFAAIGCWGLGYPERAVGLMDETVALARGGDPYSLSFTLSLAALLRCLRGDHAGALETAEEAIGLAREQGFPTVLMIAEISWGRAVGGSRGIEKLQSVIQQTASFAARMPQIGGWYFLLARACLEAGRTEEALSAVQSGLDAGGESVLYEGRLYQAYGEVRLQQGAIEDAQRSFRRALAHAREREAKTWELQAATSLARLLRDQGRGDEARAELQPVYDWFTEGFDTAALIEARSLLEEL